MSILKILAGVILVGSLVTFLVQLKKGSTKSSVLFVASALLSVGLFFLAGLVEKQLVISDAENGANAGDGAQAALTAQPGEVAEVPADNVAVNDAPEAPADNVAANDAPEAPADNVAANDAPEAPADNVAVNDAPEAPADDVAANDAPEAPADDVVAANDVPADNAADNHEQNGDNFDFDDSSDAGSAENIAPAANDAPDAPVAQAPVLENDPLAPTAVAGNDVAELKVNETVKFDGSRSKKKKASIKTYHWDFGDGTSAETAKASHAYKEQGVYEAVLTITDADDHKAQAIRKINVNRPENKIRFITNKRVADASSVRSSPAELSGTFTKTYSGSKAILEASANVEAGEGCTCSLTVALHGPGCNVVQTKKLSDGGEGETSAKTQCHGEVGEYTWSIKRTNSGACECSWLKMSIDGYES